MGRNEDRKAEREARKETEREERKEAERDAGTSKWKEFAGMGLVFLVIFSLVGIVCSLVGFALLKFLGFTYESAGWLAAFFVLYLVIGFLVSFVTEAFPKALRTVLGFGELVYQGIYAVVDIAAEILVVLLVDAMLPGVSIPLRTVLFFGVLMYLLERIFAILTHADQEDRARKGQSDG